MSRFKSGEIHRDRLSNKYTGVKDLVKFRSGLEHQFIVYCEKCNDIESWDYEPFNIKYISSIDNRQHRYIIDFVIKMKTGITILIEVKPRSQVPQKLNEAILNHPKFAMNASKWFAAIDFAKNQTEETQFKIITEQFFKR